MRCFRAAPQLNRFPRGAAASDLQLGPRGPRPHPCLILIRKARAVKPGAVFRNRAEASLFGTCEGTGREQLSSPPRLVSIVSAAPCRNSLRRALPQACPASAGGTAEASFFDIFTDCQYNMSLVIRASGRYRPYERRSFPWIVIQETAERADP